MRGIEKGSEKDGLLPEIEWKEVEEEFSGQWKLVMQSSEESLESWCDERLLVVAVE